MSKNQLRAKDVSKIGFQDNVLVAKILHIVKKEFRDLSKEKTLQLLQQLYANPEQFAETPLKSIVADMSAQASTSKSKTLLPRALPFAVFGEQFILDDAQQQMQTAMMLPVALAGALMPDAHHGYGLPIGGVLATENAIIPYGVGMDIGCRMCLSIMPVSVDLLDKNQEKWKRALMDNTRFGINVFEKRLDHEVLERAEFREIPTVKRLHYKAFEQIGSSGSGNHFVEWGIVDITAVDNEMNLPLGQYVGILSHSGSRGLGANLAQHYTKLAMSKCPLPKFAQHLAWLDMDSEAGQEYWLAMNLAGDYASACHHQIHQRLATFLGEKPLAMVENHHNFAWKEPLPNGKMAFVHRKGATPAAKGVLGIIPGSMTAPGFIVRGKGNADSLQSASHGAGRAMSRTKAKEQFTASDFRKYVKNQGVTLIDGDVDESPFAYKNIMHVMAAQSELVDVLGTFLPKIVRMDNANDKRRKDERD